MKLSTGILIVLCGYLTTSISIVQAKAAIKTDWEAYVSAIVIPDVIDMTQGGHLDLRIAKGRHQWTEDGTISGDIYGYGVNDSRVTFPGPTIKVRKDQAIDITWKNELLPPHILGRDLDESLFVLGSNCFPDCGIPIVPHVDGLTGPANYTAILMNGMNNYIYSNKQSSRTLVYHDLAVGLRRLNTWAGLMGMYIIEDKEVDEKFNVNMDFDLPLMINDRIIDINGQMVYPNESCQNETESNKKPEGLGIVNIVNGRVMPYVQVPNQQVRLRLNNMANARTYNLDVPFADRCLIIANENGYVDKTTITSSMVTLTPFQGQEWICDFSKVLNGTSFEVVDKSTDVENINDLTYDPRVMKFVIDSSLKVKKSIRASQVVPKELQQHKSLKTLYEETRGEIRTLSIDEKVTNMDCQSTTPVLNFESHMLDIMTIPSNSLYCSKGKVEKWIIKNPTTTTLPLRLPIVSMQCGSSGENFESLPMSKTAMIYGKSSSESTDTETTVCYVACTPEDFLVEGSTTGPKDFGFDTKGLFMARSLLLHHSENLMMTPFRVVDDDSEKAKGSQDSSASTSGEVGETDGSHVTSQQTIVTENADTSDSSSTLKTVLTAFGVIAVLAILIIALIILRRVYLKRQEAMARMPSFDLMKIATPSNAGESLRNSS